MRIGKAQPTPGQRINIGGLNLAPLAAIAVHIPNPQVIRENKDNIRPGRSVKANRQQEQQDQMVHGQVLPKMGATAKWIAGSMAGLV
jgi:hypothetical protein